MTPYERETLEEWIIWVAFCMLLALFAYNFRW